MCFSALVNSKFAKDDHRCCYSTLLENRGRAYRLAPHVSLCLFKKAAVRFFFSLLSKLLLYINNSFKYFRPLGTRMDKGFAGCKV